MFFFIIRAVLNIVDNIQDMVATVAIFSFWGYTWFSLMLLVHHLSFLFWSLGNGHTNTCCFIIYLHIDVE